MRLPADDLGAASERTALAWLRTSAVYATLGGMTLTLTLTRHDQWIFGIVIAAILAACSYVVGHIGSAAYARRRRDEWYVGDARAAAALAIATVVAACAIVGSAPGVRGVSAPRAWCGPSVRANSSESTACISKLSTRRVKSDRQ